MFTSYIFREEGAFVNFGKIVDPFEDVVGKGVSASALPPSFDNAVIVAIYNEMLFWCEAGGECA